VGQVFDIIARNAEPPQRAHDVVEFELEGAKARMVCTRLRDRSPWSA
jgi:hypothetical protein